MINSKIRALVASFPIIIAICATGVSSAYALTKMYQTLPNPNQEVVEIAQINDAESQEIAGEVPDQNDESALPEESRKPFSVPKTVTKTPVPIVSVLPSTFVPVATAPSSSGEFSSSSLASHNKAGDCYIAFSGTVYNVSNHPAWNGCFHHGMSGGSDITSRFPHPTSYLSSLPMIGKFMGSTNSQTGQTIEPSSNNGEKYDDEYDEEEHEDENNDRDEDDDENKDEKDSDDSQETLDNKEDTQDR